MFLFWSIESALAAGPIQKFSDLKAWILPAMLLAGVVLPIVIRSKKQG
ncbi:MAG: hypothetical protein Q4F65_11920 [Propionibacteriaceae bacterium]|nr:hypothetical protein [Propionibacteriaceae bacterium]